ncbi:serine/threonine protein kinase [Streptomyces sp. Act143]|uniref:serine/threonine-protein kinase n=1 Tax=Streptomyces sp. Act143 TaxID=2200760 RepID=UPI000D683C28|nr:serine/threonine-protein kinase [Streptomyces sp. Act143]PWI17528.1 serine/threonine protein kinase [Streptomyces sp. Act143]
MSNDGGGASPKGRLIGGRYRLVERIGSGGMGTVWRALDELVDREVAVKQPRLPGDPEDEAHQRASHRLYREARAAARVDHPAAVSIHDVVVEDGLPWIVMELVRGESLDAVLRRGPVGPAESARIGRAVLGALRAAHSVGIVHRDVKPANVLLGTHGRVVLTDFGIAHVQGEESLTVSGEFVGSLDFVAPERMAGKGAGPASDLWSLGVLLYAAVEGEPPFRRSTVESTLAAVLSHDPPEPERAGPLGPLITALLAKDPDRRPDAAEAAEVLEAAAEGWPVPPLAAVAPAQKPDRIPELGEDADTTRLRKPEPAAQPDITPVPVPAAQPDITPVPEPPAQPDTTAVPVPPAQPKPRPLSHPLRRSLSHPLRRPLPAALLAVALVGGAWAGTSYFLADPAPADPRETAAVQTATPAPKATDVVDEPWTRHREKGMNAVLAVPSRYTESVRQGSPNDQPRIVIYESGEKSGDIQVRLSQWDKAPVSLETRAQQQSLGWASYGDADTRITDTSLDGYDALLADTTYDDEGFGSTRVMQLTVLTGDGRMYELRVDMPKGTPQEKEGTSVFKAARDRLEIGKSSS